VFRRKPLEIIPNNWTGAYTLNGGGTCPAITQPIKFDVKTEIHLISKKLLTVQKQNKIQQDIL
jgi:hypothetical protein